jgi:hypothetical protein
MDLSMDQIAESYVRLVLSLGEHDANYVDAYYGPESWREEAKKEARPLAAIGAEAERLLSTLQDIGQRTRFDEMGYLRHQYLTGQIGPLKARVSMLEGTHFSFDEESRALYDAVAPRHDEAFFQRALAELDRSLPPGREGASVQERYEEFRKAFFISREKLDTVFAAAIQECRRRTREHLQLPEGESFVVEYVRNKPWSAYNWYQGNGHSLIQVNTDLPISIDRAVDLAAHEGYPGHHVYNALLEENLARRRGWVEFTVYPLFSPQSLIAEGSGNYGIPVCFTREERLAFERTVLFPLAGLDPSRVEEYYKVVDLTTQLAYADNESARGYLDGTMTREEAVQWLVKYRLMTVERAEQRMRFVDTYRSYVINYNLGQDLVRTYIESRAGSDPKRRWEEFGRLISSPRLPSGLR